MLKTCLTLPRHPTCVRQLSFYSSRRCHASASYSLTCGLEIHAQLLTSHKLFSNSETSFNEKPNSNVSYYDASLPGTQPILNLRAVLLALKAAVALDCDVQNQFSFDRKHYFYGDQPCGYQITQHYEPFAKKGALYLYPRDGVKEEVPIRIHQIQLEQDTGKSIYIDSKAMIDLNRTNTCLIELVTKPDIPTAEAAGIFVKKLQMLLRRIGVCSGELESGAMRVDVNVSVNGGQRCEIKNLSSTSAVVHAIRAEFKRQVQLLKKNKPVEMETRGWDGKNTWKLRGKEEGVDYRYMPDPEVTPLRIEPEVLDRIKLTMPELPDETFQKLLAAPYYVPLKDARTLMSVPGLVDYYLEVYNYVKHRGAKKLNAVSNWIIHRLWGELNQAEKDFSPNIIPAASIGDILIFIENGNITQPSGVLILKHLISNDAIQPITEIIQQYDLGKTETDSDDAKFAMTQVCNQVISQNSDVVQRIVSGKTPKSIKYLVGQVMRETQGKIDASEVERELKSILKV